MFRRRAVNKYYKNLIPYLKKRYGKSASYTAGQISRTVSECGFSTRYTPYALALFLDKEELHIEIIKNWPNVDESILRKYIADRFFSGNINYSYEEAITFLVGNSGFTSISHFEASNGH